MPVEISSDWGEPPEDNDETPQRYRFTSGASFILDAADRPTAYWGRGVDVLAAEGESLLIAGPQGTGKSTLAQQLALGRCGFDEYAELVGYPVVPGLHRTLYLAMDRPRQIARSFRRMVGEAWRDELDDRLTVWIGPPPRDLAKVPGLLARMADDAGADTVVVDSTKDAALGLSDDEVGGAWNRARQHTLANGVQVVELHHNRKAINGAKRDRLTIDDVFGSTWITSGAGSVVLLSGSAGDPIVGFHHVKQPLAEVGPLQIFHDPGTGRTTVWHTADLVALAAVSGNLSALDAAKVLFETEKPSPAEKQKARRRLDALTRNGSLRVVDEGDEAAAQPRLWGAS